MMETIRGVVEGTAPGVSQTGPLKAMTYSYKIHAFTHSRAGVGGVCVTDEEYPDRVANNVIRKAVLEFLEKNPLSAYRSGNPVPFPEIDEYFKKYQNPENDPLMKVQKELDETKIVMQKTIDSMLERGQTLDQLMATSDKLRDSTKQFYKDARKQNSCCTIM